MRKKRKDRIANDINRKVLFQLKISHAEASALADQLEAAYRGDPDLERVQIERSEDSLVFVTIAFAGTIPPAALLNAIVAQWLVKSSYEALATPVTYWVTNSLERLEGVDVYDTDTDFSPIALSE